MEDARQPRTTVTASGTRVTLHTLKVEGPTHTEFARRFNETVAAFRAPRGRIL